MVETFVDPSRFSGTVYTAAGWEELGLTQGNSRKSRDYYEPNGQPKRLFVKALERTACEWLQAQTLPPELAPVEEKSRPAPIRRTRCSRSWPLLIWREPRVGKKTWPYLPKAFRNPSAQL